MNKRVRAFYSTLFCLDPVDSKTCRVLWEGLLTVSHDNKSTDIDGLTVEFYKKFWDVLGPVFSKVLAEAYKTG